MSRTDFCKSDEILVVFFYGDNRIVIARDTISSNLFGSEFLDLFNLELEFLSFLEFEFFGF